MPSPDPLLQAFAEAVAGDDDAIDLARAALLIAQVEYPDLKLEPWLREIDAMARQAAQAIARAASPVEQVQALTSVVIDAWGLRGAEEDYYDPRNSFLNDVLARRLGIPVSLSIVYMSVGARAGVPLAGTAMPMHFLVRVLGVRPPRFVDCYNRGALLTEEDCRERLRRASAGRFRFAPEALAPISNAAVLTRLLSNLKLIYLNGLQYGKAAPILDRLILLNPDEASFLRERGIVNYRLGRRDLARSDLQDYLQHEGAASDAEAIRNLLRRIG